MSDAPELVPDWRRLLDHIRIPWTDRGSNVGRGRINIKCPWCGVHDPSMHLSIDTTKLVYACLRSPKQHSSGHRGGAIKLIAALGYGREANQLLDNYATTTVSRAPPAPATGVEKAAVLKRWNRFNPAAENRKVLAYLYEQRGFSDPAAVCIRYDLRFAPHGEWAGRVLFPLYDAQTGQLESWVGRAFFKHLLPKYRTPEVAGQEGLIYTGRLAQTRRTAIIVEGPFDALKINAACEHLPVSAAALTGLALADWTSPSPDRLFRVRHFLQPAETRLVALDATVPVSQVNQIIKTLVAFQPREYIIRHLPIPPGGTDPGAMSYEEVRDWITAYLTVLGGNYHGAPPANIA